MGHRLAGGILSDLLSGVGRALARALKPNPSRGGPPDDMPLRIRDAYLRIIERGQNVSHAGDDVLRAFGLDDLLSGEIVGEQFGGGRSGTSGRHGRGAFSGGLRSVWGGSSGITGWSLSPGGGSLLGRLGGFLFSGRLASGLFSGSALSLCASFFFFFRSRLLFLF